MDDAMEDAHGEDESPQMTDSDEDEIMAQMATPPEMPVQDDEEDEELQASEQMEDDEEEEDDNAEDAVEREDQEDQEVSEDRETQEEPEDREDQIEQEEMEDRQEPEEADEADEELEDQADMDAEDQDSSSAQAQADKPASSSYLLTRTIPQPRWTINELRGATMEIAFMRQRLFDVKVPIELKADEFEYYFPYIDNVWVRQHKSRPFGQTPGTTKGTLRTDYYACRLQRPTYHPRKPHSGPDGQPLRKKKTREGGTCKVRLRAVHYEGGVHAVTVSRVGDAEHSHGLEDMDRMKRNSVVMDIARSEVMKGYAPASVYNMLNGDPAKLAILGGKFLTRSDVRNASQAWRAAYKGTLKSHPGYSASDPIGPTLAPKTVPLMPAMPAAPPGPVPTGPPVLPPDALMFNPVFQPFLEPYLPRYDTNSKPGALPHVTLTYATSLDSFLALAPGVQTHLSGPLTKAMTHYLRSRHDAILVGVGTAAVDNPTLNCRIAGAGGYGGIGWAMHPRPVILDPMARWPIDPKHTNVLRAASEGRGRAPWIIVAPGFHLEASRSEMLKYFGGKYLGLADLDTRYQMRPHLKWEAVFRALAGEGIRSVMVEGGGSVINDLLSGENRHMISSVVLTMAPTYMGMGGVVVCPNRAFGPDGRPRPVARFKDVRWCPMGEDVVMAGRFAPETLPVFPAAAAAAAGAQQQQHQQPAAPPQSQQQQQPQPPSSQSQAPRQSQQAPHPSTQLSPAATSQQQQQQQTSQGALQEGSPAQSDSQLVPGADKGKGKGKAQGRDNARSPATHPQYPPGEHNGNRTAGTGTGPAPAPSAGAIPPRPLRWVAPGQRGSPAHRAPRAPLKHLAPTGKQP